MKPDLKSDFSADIAQKISVDPVLNFVSRNYEGLWHAARLLGGYESARLVDRCVELLAQDQCVSQQARIMLDQILAVLSLEHVHDENLPYMGFFAVIDPCDPAVEEICLLTDGLRHVLSCTIGETGLRCVA
ncbi:hypothetical protein [Palleronia pelagia]|uniref:Uncharacterized protein n=1 Tax=Palleronia pelagia TaxID=387096 RepID=A0A1H8BFD6_9RHOB|nr:hypothetical protein [Palleronia pelagia]SEM81179.1 hypothetical protein SAMN04488011_101562 [Palleronia pelagia]